MKLALLPRLRVFARILLAFLGGYYVSVGLAAFLGVVLALAAGGTRMDAYFAAGMSSSLIFCGVLIWAFCERRLLLLCGVFCVVTAVSFTAAQALEPFIPLPAQEHR
jgi:hypothetical protein